MTAIFTGLGSGLAKSSATALGSAGTLGSASTGRGGEAISVNAATGNLLISRRDEFLTGRSLDIGISRTYNSLAEVHDGDNGDQWQMSTARRVFGFSGTLNAAGSTIKRVSGDGSVVTYSYETRSGIASYWATDGSGTHDRMWKSGGDWIWQDGSTRIRETYDADPNKAGEFRLVNQTDKDGQSLVFTYSGDKLTRVTTNNGEYVEYAWSGNKITSIKTSYTDLASGTGYSETGTYYSYDGNGRLATVTFDLSPDEAGTGDGYEYTISYLYDAAGRITRVSQSDGSRTDVVYDGDGRVTQLTEHVGDGTTRVTGLSYGSNYTNVTAPNGQVTKLEFGDNKGPNSTLDWGHSATYVLSELADSIDGTPTGLFTSAPGAGWSGVSRGIGTVAAGQTVTFEISLQAVAGSSTTQSLGLYGTTSKWGSDVVSAEIVGGPGQIAQASGGLFTISGLSTTDDTRIRITRTYAQSEDAAAYFYIDHPGGYRDGQQLLAGGATLSLSGQKATSSRLLTKITAPAAYAGAAAQVQSFTYDADGNLLSSTAPDGGVTSYTYDARGNVTKVDRPIGTDVTKWYDANDNLIKELSYVSNEASANTSNYVRYAYDGENHLRYKVTAEGHVTEYRYDSYGRLVWEGDYTKYAYAYASTDISESGMDAWRDGLADKTQVDWMNYRYDARGNLSETVNYGAATSTGGATSSSSLEGYSRTYYVYDQQGRLVTRYQQNETGKEQFVYDGLGRLISSTDASGAVTSVFFDDANTRTVMQMASGMTRTMVYDKTGGLVSEIASSVGPVSENKAGDLGGWSLASQVTRTSTTAIAGQPAYLYSIAAGSSYGNTNKYVGVSAGETIKYRITVKGNGVDARHRIGIYGTVDQWGAESSTKATAVIIDGPGRLARNYGGLWWLDGISSTETTTIEITRTFDVAQSAGSHFYVGGSGTMSVNTSVILTDPVITKTTTDAAHDFSAETRNKFDKLGRLRVTQDMFDGRGENYIIYDKAGRKAGTVDSLGKLTEYFYDSANRLIGTTTYWNTVSTTVRGQLANPDNTLEMSAIRPSFNDTYDMRSITTYDANGRVAQTINGEGEVVSFKYDGSGRLIETRNHYNKVTIASGWRTSPPTSVAVANHANDAVTRTFYDRDGNVRGVLDGEGYLSEITYDQSGQKTVETAYAKKISSSLWASGTFNQLRSDAGTSSVNNRYVRYVYNGRGELRFQIDSANYVTQFKYNYAGKLTTTTVHNTALAGSHTDWTIEGVKAALATHSNDRTISNSIDTFGRVYRTTDANGIKTHFAYDYAGNVTRVIVGEGRGDQRVTRNWYDARGNLRYTLDPEGYLTSFLYNEGGQVTHERRYDAKKSASDSTTFAQAAALATGGYAETRQTYDALGRVSYRYNAVGTITRYAYQYNGLLSYVTVGHGTNHASQTVYYYDNAGRVTEQHNANGESEEAIVYYTYDGLGNQTQVKDGNGNIAYFTYDQRGSVLTEKNGAGNQVKYEYNAFGEVVKTWDAKNTLASEHVYNKLGQVTKSYDALRNATNYTYTQFGEVKTVTDALGAVTTFTYDKLGRVVSTKDALNKTESYGYDAYGNRTSVTNKLGGSITYAYDKLGRMTSMNDANGIVTAYTYDARGNRITVTEASGLSEARKTTYTYDAANRVTQSSVEGHSTSYVTQYAYDSRGNVTRTIAPDGGKTIYYYDDLNRVTVEINALGTYTAYTYDKNGNVKTIKVYETTVTVPSNGGHEEGQPAAPAGTVRETRFDYDAANRMTKSHVMGVTSRYYNGTSLAAYSGTTITTQYVYDANGNVVKTIDPNGGVTWAYYDAMGRKQHQVDAQNYRTTWTYDAGGNVTREVRYANAVATPTSTTSVPGVTADSSIDRRTDYTYDTMGNRLTEKRINVKYHNGSGAHSTGTATVTYAYNALGQVTKKTEAVSGNVTDYNYDAGGRLTKETRAAFTDFNGNSVRPVVDYYYDGLGNLTRTRQAGATGAAERNTYYYYKKGQLDRVTDAGGLTRYHRYDSAGRETEVYYTRTNYSGTARTEGVKRSYDQLGRVVSEFQGTKSGSTWTAVSPTVATTYNAFGEVATIKAGTGAAQVNTYDNAGRLVKTNAGDGVYKLFAHDRNGNQTAAITSAGYQLSGQSFSSALSLITRADVNISYTTYDKRGSALKVYETDRDISATASDQTLVTERRYNAFGEVSYEKDALGADIYYDYTTMGKVWRVQNPSVAIQNEDGTTATVRPTEYYYHDLGGRLVAQRDANGNLTRLGLLNGTGFAGGEALVTTETYADGGVKTTQYDIHGDARRIIGVADGRTSTQRTIEQTFDAMGRVTQTWNRGTDLQDNYTYDLAGQQLSHWNNVYGSANREITDYDAMGRVISSRAFGGDTTTTAYTWEVSSNTNAVGNFGGWKEVTTTLTNNRTLTEWSDLFDRTTRKNDFGGHDFTYTFDVAGRLSSTTGSGANQQYTYYNTGKLKSISNVTGVLNSMNFQELKTTYGYDKVGNLTSQKTTDRGSTFYEFYWNPYEPDFYSYDWNRTTQNMTATYDKLGRIKTWSEAGGGDLPAASMEWAYDANGNIRRSKATYRNIFSDQTIATSNSTQEYWYRYDSMNRVVTSRGVLLNGQISRGTGGMDIVYNKAGQRTSVTTTQRESYRWYYDEFGGEDLYLREPGFDDGFGSPYDPYGSGYWRTDYYNADVREDYLYDAGGRLKQVNVAKSGFDALGWEDAVTWGFGNQDIQNYVTAVPATGAKKGDYLYDQMSRITQQRDYSGSTVVYSRNVYYDTQGLISRDDSTTKKGSDSYRANQYNYYLADNSLNYSYTYNYKNGSTSGVTNSKTTNTYVYYDGAVQSRVDFDSNTGSTSDRIYNSTYSYDAFGVLQSAQVNDGRARSVTFINNAEGQVISRKERDNKYDQGDPSEIYYRFGGKEIGRVGNDGTSNVTYEKSITERTKVAPTTPGAFRSGATYGSSYADFGGDYDAINSFAQGAGGGTYTVRGGESLQAIAMQLWGDSSLWYKLAEANGLSGREPLIEGRNLVIPTGIQRVHHNSGTMKPYDPAEAIGDTSPTTPDAPKKKKKKCGVLGAVLLAVVAIAVTVVTSGALAAASISAVTGSSVSIGAGLSALAGATVAGATITTVGAITIGAAAAAAGSIVSQAVGVASGIQDKFSWKAVGLAALGGAVGGALGPNGVFGRGGLFGAENAAGQITGGALGNIQSGVVRAGLNGLASSSINQGIAVMSGLQDNFSWVGVAAAGVGAAAGQLAGQAIGARSFSETRSLGNVTANLLKGGARLIANAATRSAIEGSSFGDNALAALPDTLAQTIGAFASAELQGASYARQNRQFLAAMGVPEQDANQILRALGTMHPDDLKSVATSGGGHSNDEIAQFLVDSLESWEAQIASGERSGVTMDDFRAFKRRVAFHLISADAYKDHGADHILPSGYDRVSQAQLQRWGITDSLLSDDDSGFSAAVYLDPEGGTILAFRGTEPTDLGDLITDLKQHAGYVAAQYEFLSDNLTTIVGALTRARGPNMTFSGHSLGGGLATVAGLMTGNPVYAIAPAAIHENTLSRYGITEAMIADLDITYAAVLGEPLQLTGQNWRDRRTGGFINRATGDIFRNKQFFFGQRDYAFPARLTEDRSVNPELSTAIDPLTSHSVMHNALSSFYSGATELGLGQSPWAWDWDIYPER